MSITKLISGGREKNMSKFDYMEFTGSSSNEFVVHAKKYTKEEALELAVEEMGLGAIELDEVIERYCRYYVRVPDFCGYDGDSNGGCYTYCGKGERGAFPVWVIEF